MMNFTKKIKTNRELSPHYATSVSPRRILTISAISFLLLFFGAYRTSAQSHVEVNGKLSVSGNYLVNEKGTPIQLRGMSTHGLQWNTETYNFASINKMITGMGINILRLAMYPTDDYATGNAYIGNPAFWKTYIDKLVDQCGQLGIYCIIDWHVLEPGNPMEPTTYDLAKDFWDYMSKKHKGKKHVLYEICNEPNSTNWSVIKEFANTIIPIIRNNDPNSVIIVGTPRWSQDVDIAAKDPITGSNAINLMYTVHFYAASHKEPYRSKVDSAISKGLAIFATEFGTMTADGNGSNDWVESRKWLDFMQKRKISWCNWSYSDDGTSSASVLEPCSAASGLWDNLNAQGDSIKKFLFNPPNTWYSSGPWKNAANVTSPIEGDYFLPNQTVFLSADVFGQTIKFVDFYVDNVKIGTSYNSPYTIQWKPSTTKNVVITAIATDFFGVAGSMSTPVTCHVVSALPAQNAYPTGTPSPIPGEINCIYYDYGGEMISYHDVDAVHKGPITGNIRQDDGVDVEKSDNIGYVLSGEWLEYTVNVASESQYDFSLTVASELPCTGQFHLESDGVPVSSIIDAPSTGKWGTYDTIEVPVALKAGKQVLRLCIDKGGFNFKKMTFTAKTGTIRTIEPSVGTGGHGMISPSTSVKVKNSGESRTFTFTPEPHYKISDVLVDGVSVGAVPSYTFSNITANHTIKVEFAILPTYTVTVIPTENAVVTPSGTTTVYEGEFNIFTIKPSTNFYTAYLNINGTELCCSGNTYVLKFTKNSTVQAGLGVNLFSSADPGGTISPNATTSVLVGQGLTYTITPATGYDISDVVDNGVSKGKLTTYPLTNVTASHNIIAKFVLKANKYSIAASATGGGTISPAGNIGVSSGGSQVYTIKAANGYILTKLTVNGVSITPVASYTFSNVTANQTIAAEFKALFKIAASAGTGGIISPTGEKSVTSGGSQTYTITPATGYIVDNVMVDNMSKGPIKTYTFSNVTENHTISATFIKAYTLTIIQSTGGTITPSGTITVTSKSIIPVKFKASADYLLTGTIFSGFNTFTDIDTSYTTTLNNFKNDQSVTAEFTQISSLIKITVTTDPGAKYSSNDPSYIVPRIIYAKKDRAFTLSISAESNFSIMDVKIDNVSKGVISSYAFGTLTGNHTVQIIVNPKTDYVSITSDATVGGTIDPVGSIAIKKGNSKSYTIKATPGYTISDVVVDGVSKGAIKKYDFTNVTAKHTISAKFVAAAPYTITASAGPGGDINPSGAIIVAKGADQTVMNSVVLPGYEVSEIIVDNVSQEPYYKYDFINVTANHTIKFVFAQIKKYVITAYTSTGGTITPSGMVTYIKGEVATYDFVPDNGKIVSDVTVDGVSQGAVKSYTFKNISADHSISVTFTDCTLLKLYNAPSVAALPSVNTTYNYAFVLGTHSSINGFKDLKFKWDLTTMQLNDFGVDLNISPWYVDLKSKITHNLGSTSPDITISGSGVGLDGNYYVVMDGTNFVLIDKSDAYAIYFSNSTTTPKDCNNPSPLKKHAITATTSIGGTINPSGLVLVGEGANCTFTITPSVDYVIFDVIVDGQSQGAIASYTFSNVTTYHTISATFVPACDLLTLYDAPSSVALPSMAYTKYHYVHVLGNKSPITTITEFNIQWDLANKGLYDFSVNLNVAPWYVDLKGKITHNLGSASPGINISGSGVGLDGNYYAVMDGSNFVLIDKSAAYGIYFSHSSTTPEDCLFMIFKKSPGIETIENGTSSIFPNPVDRNSTFIISLSSISSNGARINIIDLNGKEVYDGILRNTINSLNLGEKVKSGIYIVRITNDNEQYSKKLIIK